MRVPFDSTRNEWVLRSTEFSTEKPYSISLTPAALYRVFFLPSFFFGLVVQEPLGADTDAPAQHPEAALALRRRLENDADVDADADAGRRSHAVDAGGALRRECPTEKWEPGFIKLYWVLSSFTEL